MFYCILRAVVPVAGTPSLRSRSLACEIILGGVVIAQRVVVEHIWWRSLRLLLLLLSLLRLLCGNVLLGRLHVFQLLTDLCQAGLQLIERVIERLDLSRDLIHVSACVGFLILHQAL